MIYSCSDASVGFLEVAAFLATSLDLTSAQMGSMRDVANAHPTPNNATMSNIGFLDAS